MLTIEQIRAALNDRRLPVVARETGLAYDTVWRIASGRYRQVQYETVKALSDYLMRGPGK